MMASLTWGSDMTDSTEGRGPERNGDDGDDAQPKKTSLAPRADYKDTMRQEAGWDTKPKPMDIDMSGGKGVPRLRIRNKTIPVTLDLPEREHQKLNAAATAEAKPMKYLARDCLLIGLAVKEAQRKGFKCAIVGSGGRIKYTIGG